MASTPTKAMLAAASDEAFHISFGGYSGFQFNDGAKIFIQAARTPFQGAGVFNLRGAVAHMSEVVAAIEAAEPSPKGASRTKRLRYHLQKARTMLNYAAY